VTPDQKTFVRKGRKRRKESKKRTTEVVIGCEGQLGLLLSFAFFASFADKKSLDGGTT
jgi:hypothetical protein